jgi:hypothetical protein
MKINFVLAAFCVICFNAFGQKSDYLVKNNGDTLWGSVKLKNKIFYINSETPVEINAEDVSKIKSGRYNGTVTSCNLQLYTDNLTDLELDYYKKGTADTVMILDEIYSTPKIILYYGVSNFRTPFYFYKTPSDNKPVQLVVRYYLQGGLDNYDKDRRRYSGESSKVNMVEDKGYVNQLHAIMGDCKKIPPAIWELLSYRGYSLKQIIKKYNKCK